MTRARAAAMGCGAAFGFLISWGTLTDPDTIHRMLQLRDAYVFLMMGAAVAVGFLGIRVVMRRPRRALLTGEPIRTRIDRIQRHHVVGSAIFGLGWAIADTCPGPVAAQLGQGLPWALCTAAGVTGGVLLFQARGRRRSATLRGSTAMVSRSPTAGR